MEEETFKATQLTELNTRARTYTTQLWTIPMTYLAAVAVLLAGNDSRFPLTAKLLVGGVLGMFVMGHLVGVEDGRDRAVKALCALDPTVQNKWLTMWWLPMAAGFFAGVQLGASLPFLGDPTNMYDPPSSTWNGIRASLTAWAEPVLAILGILTLIGAVWAWIERWRTVNLQVARRARRVLRVLDEWAAYPATFAGGTDFSPTVQKAAWRDVMVEGEDEVQELLEGMLDRAGRAGPLVRQRTRVAYRLFLLGSDLINPGSQRVDEAAERFKEARAQLAKIVPRDLV